jgi:hypothetical protein
VTVYRPADLAPDSDERAFVISTWASSYKHSHYAGLISAEDWAPVMHAQLGKLLDRPTTRAIVACAPPAFLYGHIVGDTASAMPVIHYVYVKDPFREAGYARGLFGALGVNPARPFLYTCRTSMAARLADKIPFARLTPAAARYTNYQEPRHGQRRP